MKKLPKTPLEREGFLCVCILGKKQYNENKYFLIGRYMAIMSVEVPDSVAKRFTPYTVVHWSDINIEEQLLKIDGDSWERSVDFGEGVSAKEILVYLEKAHG